MGEITYTMDELSDLLHRLKMLGAGSNETIEFTNRDGRWGLQQMVKHRLGKFYYLQNNGWVRVY